MGHMTKHMHEDHRPELGPGQYRITKTQQRKLKISKRENQTK